MSNTSYEVKGPIIMTSIKFSSVMLWMKLIAIKTFQFKRNILFGSIIAIQWSQTEIKVNMNYITILPELYEAKTS